MMSLSATPFLIALLLQYYIYNIEAQRLPLSLLF